MQRILSPVPMPARLCMLLTAALCLLALSACGQTQDPETPAAETDSDSADVEVTFATDQGGETHYLFLQGENFYDIWLQEGALSPEAGQAAMDRIMAGL